ncbi:hypothetical protein [Streptomyces cellulosae]|uniref:hypothetical protein n=1 Tax=Streptomyces cellulosae TaxID=1968 RepID=UPI00131C6BCD|nr:hypothetical protein [Streptomyces cellulosae]
MDDPADATAMASRDSLGKGIPALWSGCPYAKRCPWSRSVAYGGGQERGLRAGTENVGLAVALGAAARIAAAEPAGGAPARIAARAQSGTMSLRGGPAEVGAPTVRADGKGASPQLASRIRAAA